MEIAAVIREIGRGASGARSLSDAQARQLYGALLDERIADLEVGALLIALRMKTESVAELSGFLAAAGERLPALRRPDGAPRPVVIPSYNGARRMANLTPLLALLLQRCAVPVLLHGPTGAAEHFGRVSSEEILRALAQPPCTSLPHAQSLLDESRAAYLPIALLSPGLHRQLALRQRLGLRNSAHSVVKMLDPFRGEGLLLAAATHPDYLSGMRAVLTATDGRALLLRACEGEPFANPKRRPCIEHLHAGRSDVLCAAAADSLRRLPQLPENGDCATTVAWMRRVLAGEIPLPSPIADQLACCLYASGRVDDLAAGRAMVSALLPGEAARSMGEEQE